LLRLADIRPHEAEAPSEECIVTDFSDLDMAVECTRGIDCIVHLAGVPREDSWERILPNNIVATFNIFEAARINSVQRVIFASSNHVIGYYRADQDVGPGAPVRPDSRYGVSKVFGEAVGRLYADKHGIDVACLRIGSFRPKPQERRQLATWVSPGDTVELVRSCIEAPPFHFLVVYGVSANTQRKWWDRAKEVLGYEPKDDAERFATDLPPSNTEGVAGEFHGGINCAAEFSGNPRRID
jgi:uronate dehydrogenase